MIGGLPRKDALVEFDNAIARLHQSRSRLFATPTATAVDGKGTLFVESGGLVMGVEILVPYDIDGTFDMSRLVFGTGADIDDEDRVVVDQFDKLVDIQRLKGLCHKGRCQEKGQEREDDMFHR